MNELARNRATCSKCGFPMWVHDAADPLNALCDWCEVEKAVEEFGILCGKFMTQGAGNERD